MFRSYRDFVIKEVNKLKGINDRKKSRNLAAKIKQIFLVDINRGKNW